MGLNQRDARDRSAYLILGSKEARVLPAATPPLAQRKESRDSLAKGYVRGEAAATRVWWFFSLEDRRVGIGEEKGTALV